MTALRHRYRNDEQRGDIERSPASTPSGLGNLATDAGLISALEISLFTDRRADDGDELPGEDDDLRGWWGDMFYAGDFDAPDFQIGSKIWQIRRSKITQQTMQRLKDEVENAVQWFVQFGIAERVSAVVERVDLRTLCFYLRIKRPGQPAPLWVGPWEVTFSGI